MKSKLSRRAFLQGTSMAALAAHPWFAALAAELGNRKLLLVGTSTGRSGSKGVYTYAFDPATGALEQIALAAECNSPTFMALSPDQKFLYTVNGGFMSPQTATAAAAPPPPVQSATQSGQPGRGQRRPGGGGGGGLTSYAFDKAAGTLTRINEVAAGPSAGVYVCSDHSGRCVFVANYGGGAMESFQVDANGKLSAAVTSVKFAAPENDPKKVSRAHRVTVSPGNGYLMVNDLGLDMIHVFKLDAATAKLTPADPPQWLSAPGAGPRALRWHPNKKIAYCVNELHPTVNVLGWDEKKGVLTTLQEIRLVPEDYKFKCAPGDVVFDKKWQHAYVTSRHADATTDFSAPGPDDFMATFKVDKHGMLTFVERTACGGIRPRDLTLDPTDNWLLIADQDSNNIAVVKRDAKTGKLSDTITTTNKLGSPMCLIFPDRPNVVL